MADRIVKVAAYKGVRIVVQENSGSFSYVTGIGFYATGFASAEEALEDAKRVIDRR